MMLWNGFLQSARLFPSRPALSVQGRTYSYEDLRSSACRLAATLQARRVSPGAGLTAVLAAKGHASFVGILGALLSGHGYVPLNPSFPPDRTRSMFNRSECRAIVVDDASTPQLATVLEGAQPTLVLLLERDDARDVQAQYPGHTVLGVRDFDAESTWIEPPLNTDSIAYLLFTSGSTGVPKGVMVTHANVTAFIDYMSELYDVNEHDRFSQLFQLTFDLSVFDMFVCWKTGACLCCPSPKEILSPARFIRDQALTIWFSAPSTVTFMKQLRMLKPGAFPTLRLSLFCGEALPMASAMAWREAAANSIVENLYGPTELTIACTRYRWSDAHSPVEAELGIVPIGSPYPRMTVRVADPDLREVPPGEVGELLMSGPQMSPGYWRDPERTAAAFVIPPGENEVFYRTGDRVRRASGNQPMTHLGRLDFQVKVLGHRVELGEIEAVIREVSGCDGVVAVGWPATASGYGGVEAFIEGGVDAIALKDAIAKRLPDYMTPRRLHVMTRLPRNANDKFDRIALTKRLEDGL